MDPTNIVLLDYIVCILLLDIYCDRNNCLDLYKIYVPLRVTPTPKVNWSLYQEAAILAYKNTWLSLALQYMVFQRLIVMRGGDIRMKKWTFGETSIDILWFVLKIPCIVWLTDIVFYVGHRAFHLNPWLYRNCHKIHHRWVETYGCVATAAHPLEQWFVNLHTVQLPTLLMNVPFHVHTAFICYASFYTVCDHSGYWWIGRITQSGITHDFHHHFQNVEFGINSWCDRLFRTRMQDKYPSHWQDFKQHIDPPKKIN
ncbi:hypothetical protein RFI_09376 [Reticulomyxa filosa]|uniref:Fatty acid hydroxylase domain-containing protein n=1 Tax=Reticulomyxa filosa TaxID=46433 RepID=X6NP11_RETFI|nr:hypothetical protein RFI_09376 [Reticulomyxa filosa]|eukprot:ETO27761.1 hypothetical protein RFI_09376 [Reticulomyxa filosa]